MPLNDHLRALWTAAGYPHGTASAAVVPPPPSHLRRVYYLTSADHAISNLVFGRIKVARFSKLNDPFELLAPKSADLAIRYRLQQYKRTFDQDYGLLCFSADWKDPVLWTHYGDRHRGVCLGFDVPMSDLKEVQYQSNRLVKTIGTKGVSATLQDLILRTKFESWRYEEEWRVLVQLRKADKEGDLHFLPFDSNLNLAEVVLGPLCTLNLKQVRTVVHAHYAGITTIKSRLAYNSFHIVPASRTVPPREALDDAPR